MPAPVDISDPFRGLSDPTRREIVSLLAAGPLPVRAIAGHFPAISRPAVSKHLRILREGGLVSERRSGRERYYSLSPSSLASVLGWLEGVKLELAGSESSSRGAARVDPVIDRSRRSAELVPERRRRSRREPAAPSRSPSASEESAEPEDWKAW